MMNNKLNRQEIWLEDFKNKSQKYQRIMQEQFTLLIEQMISCDFEVAREHEQNINQFMKMIDENLGRLETINNKQSANGEQ